MRTGWIIGTRRLRAGDEVIVRSLPEILATLDGTGAHEGMPFMPEMARFCGQRLRVASRAHKSCDTLHGSGAVKLIGDAVHLVNARCDGSMHGGCAASCNIFWKEAWLRPVGDEDAHATRARDGAQELVAMERQGEPRPALPADWSVLATVPRSESNDRPARRYRCQATEAPRFSRRLEYWRASQYLEDLESRNVGLGQMFWSFVHSACRHVLALGIGYRLFARLFDWIERTRGRPGNPYVSGLLDRTPTDDLDLQPGELVRIKSFAAIMATLNRSNRNRGLWFVPEEMGQFCGRTARVHRRVDRLIDERTGEMLSMKTPAVILAEVNCTGTAVDKRLFCPRASALMWREIWLERCSAPPMNETRQSTGSSGASLIDGAQQARTT